jgi:hypothetical protein
VRPLSRYIRGARFGENAKKLDFMQVLGRFSGFFLGSKMIPLGIIFDPKWSIFLDANV